MLVAEIEDEDGQLSFLQKCNVLYFYAINFANLQKHNIRSKYAFHDPFEGVLSGANL